MSWAPVQIVVSLVIVAPGCGGAAAPSGDAPVGAAPTPSAAAATSKPTTPTPTAPPPAQLPPCRAASKDDPLAVLCTVGAPAPEAHFECERPEPLLFCGRFDEWSCRYAVAAGKLPPTVTYHARFEHVGPPVKTGEILPDDAFQRTGIVRGVSIHERVPDAAAGNAKAAALSETLRGWGCVAREPDGDTLACGSWGANVRYNDIIDQVILDAALEGFLECDG